MQLLRATPIELWKPASEEEWPPFFAKLVNITQITMVYIVLKNTCLRYLNDS